MTTMPTTPPRIAAPNIARNHIQSPICLLHVLAALDAIGANRDVVSRTGDTVPLGDVGYAVQPLHNPLSLPHVRGGEGEGFGPQ